MTSRANDRRIATEAGSMRMTTPSCRPTALGPAPAHRTSRGAITLLVTIALVILAALASHYSTRSVLMDQLASSNQIQASQTRLAAESALAWAQAELQRQYGMPDAPPDLWDHASRQACPPGLDALRWQCTRLSVPPAADGSEQAAALLQVTALRDLLTSPHVTQLQAQASLQRSHAQVRQSLYVPALATAPVMPPTAAIVLNGCLSATGNATVCPRNDSSTTNACTGQPTAPAAHSLRVPDADGNGQISATERSACLALSAAQLPGGGELTGPAVSGPGTNVPCNRAAWRSVLGNTTSTQIQAWSAAQERNGLHAQSQPPRSIYWVDSPADWSLSAGQPGHPVLLVFSAAACATRCPRITPGTHVQGTVVLDSGCQDDKVRGWSAGWLEGQLVVESGLPELASGSQIRGRQDARQAFDLLWPTGIDARQVQSIPGSWTTGAP